MTVCVAAICENRMVVGASDRLITAGDIQFEPSQTKIYQLTTTIGVMVSGDNLLNDEILKGVTADMNASITAQPDVWVGVEEAAELYRKYYQIAFLKRVEGSILAPLNLDRNTFITQQKLMDSDLVTKLARDILNFEPSSEGVEVIVAGVDASGPHLYVCNGSDIHCWDNPGFAAVGKGYWHAQSQLMFAGHAGARLLPEVLLDVYFAKKRAEVAPHVGEYTDMFFVGPNVGTFTRINPQLIAKLDEIYRGAQKKENQARSVAKRKINEYIQRQLEAAIAKAQEANPEDGIGGTVEGQNGGGDAAEDQAND